MTDKSGAVCLPPEQSCDLISQDVFATLKAKNAALENTLSKIKKELADVIDDREAAYNDIKLVKEERDEVIKTESDAFKHTIDILEKKVAKAEAITSKLFEEKKSNEEAYRKQIKPLNDEINARKKDSTDLKKIVKEKEKELFRVNNKCENLELTVKRIKMENAASKNVKKKLDRGKKLELRKKETSSFALTGGFISECANLEVSPGNPFLNTSLSQSNNNICESIKPLCPPDLSPPRTPPGPPPTTAAGLSTTSSPAPEVQQPTAPPDAIATGKYDDHDQESSDEKPKLEGKKHVAINDEFVKLLESIKNAKLSSDEEQDDDYGSVDHESYPDYYWQMGYETYDGKHFEISEEELHSPLQTIAQ